MKKCTMEDCEKPLIAKGMCHMHYRRELRKNPKEEIRHYGKNKGKECSVEVCNRPATRTGLCLKHYQKKLKYGNPNEGKSYKTD